MKRKECRPSSARITVLLLAVLAVAAGGILAAANLEIPDPAYNPPAYSGPAISLMEAVQLTLQHEPNIKLQAEAATQQRGLAQQATGQFDLALVGKLDYSFIQTELTAAEKQTEIDKRDNLREDFEEQSALADEEAALANEYFNAWQVLANGGDPSTVTFTDPINQAEWDIWNATLAGAPPADQAQIRNDIIKWLQEHQKLAEKARDEAVRQRISAAEQLRALGPVPQVSQQQQGTLNLQLSKMFRSGVVMTPSFQISGQSFRYRGKSNDPDTGGPGSPDTYNAQVSFKILVPLGRGHGVESAGALEKSALIDYESRRLTTTHQASSSVLNSILAYWNMVAAQEALSIQQESLALQVRLVELTKALIDGDELPRAEMARAEARQAEVEAQVEDAQRTLHQARVTLARTIGLRVEDTPQAPLASDGFPPAPANATLDPAGVRRLGELGLSHRFDLQAAHKLEESGKVLWRAAVIDLAAVTDVDGEFFYKGQHSGGSMWDGVNGSLFGNWTGPSAKFSLTYNRPFANNVQEGQLEQRAASLRQRVITARDLARTIRANVVQQTGVLAEAIRQLGSYERSVVFYKQTVANELEKLKYGKSTLIDTILTEQRMVLAQLALVSSEQQVARSLAQLRYETGTLIEKTGSGELISKRDILSLPGAPGGS